MYDTLLETIELVVLITYVRSFTYLPENLLNLIKFQPKPVLGTRLLILKIYQITNITHVFRRIYDESYKYEDVIPRNATTFTIGGLEKNTDYVFSVMAINKIGQSKYRPDDTKVTTLSKF